jgi:hypothetical protein
VVGGSGFYLQAYMNEMNSQCDDEDARPPPGDATTREYFTKFCQEHGWEAT